MMTFKELRERIAMLGDTADDALLRINGEYVQDCELVVSYPIVDRPGASGMRELSHNKARSTVIDIAANGRKVEALPIDIIR